MNVKPSLKSKVLPVRLDPETQMLLGQLQAKTGLKGAALIRMCIRRMADRLDLLDRDHPEQL